MTVLIGAIGVVLGALVGAIATYLTSRSTMRVNLEHSYNQTLRDVRLAHYQRLFWISRCLSRYWPPGRVVTRKDLHQFYQDFHDWYFSEEAGGMFLTAPAKDVYMQLLNLLVEVMHGDGGESATDESPISETELQGLRGLASDLRHQLAEDVGSANPPHLRWVRLSRTIAPPPLPPASSDPQPSPH